MVESGILPRMRGYWLMAADALMVTAVNKTYGDKHVVKDISFSRSSRRDPRFPRP